MSDNVYRGISQGLFRDYARTTHTVSTELGDVHHWPAMDLSVQEVF